MTHLLALVGSICCLAFTALAMPFNYTNGTNPTATSIYMTDLAVSSSMTSDHQRLVSFAWTSVRIQSGRTTVISFVIDPTPSTPSLYATDPSTPALLTTSVSTVTNSLPGSYSNTSRVVSAMPFNSTHQTSTTTTPISSTGSGFVTLLNSSLSTSTSSSLISLSTASSTTTTCQTSIVTTTSITPSPSPLNCGVHYSLTPGKGFDVCNGDWIIADFCSEAIPGNPPLVNARITPRTRYYALRPDSGVVVYMWDETDPGECDYSWVIPAYPPIDPYYGDENDSRCMAILGALMNDCDTTTRSKKMGGTLTVGCEKWNLFSVVGALGPRWPAYGGDLEGMLEQCPTDD